MSNVYDTASDEYDRAFAALVDTAKECKEERDQYEAALRKIAAWKGYQPAPTWFETDETFTDYERGANDMLETLQAMAREALA